MDARVPFDEFDDDALHGREAGIGDPVLQDRRRTKDLFDSRGVNRLRFPFERLFEKLISGHGLGDGTFG